MNVPLIQKPETNDINASLIAIRKQLQILNESVNNIESKYLLKSELKELSSDTVGGDGKYIESISESNGIINAVEKSLGNMTPVDTVTSGNTHSVTSGAVYEAIGKVNRINADIDTLYPSENNKVVYYSGTFSGNVPDSRATAILKTIRSESTSNEIQLYQEWESYQADAPYNPNKYIRFGYFTGSASPTWSAWQKVQRGIKYKEVTIPSITIGANGYTQITQYKPIGMTNFMFALLNDYGNVSTKDAFTVNAAGNYISGTVNASITNVTIRYFYTD